MKFKLGDVVCIKDKKSPLWRGDAPLYVKERCDTPGQWVDRHSVDINYLKESPYCASLFDYFKKPETKFKIGDKVISVKNTPSTREGFIGIIRDIEYGEENPIEVVSSGVDLSSELFKEDELELLDRRDDKSWESFFSVAKEEEVDLVNSPKHYSVFEDVEAIHVIASSMTKDQFYGYCLGNILKYRLRAGGKDDVMQELGKADKYQELFTEYKHLCKE